MTEPYRHIHVSTFEAFFKSEDWRRNWIATNRPEKELEVHDKRMSVTKRERNSGNDFRSRQFSKGHIQNTIL